MYVEYIIILTALLTIQPLDDPRTTTAPLNAGLSKLRVGGHSVTASVQGTVAAGCRNSHGLTDQAPAIHGCG